MDFLNVGPWELVVVLVIAVLVAGPERMVEIARTLGRFSRELRQMSSQFTAALRAEVEAAEREASGAMDGVRESLIEEELGEGRSNDQPGPDDDS